MHTQQLECLRCEVQANGFFFDGGEEDEEWATNVMRQTIKTVDFKILNCLRSVASTIKLLLFLFSSALDV